MYGIIVPMEEAMLLPAKAFPIRSKSAALHGVDHSAVPLKAQRSRYVHRGNWVPFGEDDDVKHKFWPQYAHVHT